MLKSPLASVLKYFFQSFRPVVSRGGAMSHPDYAHQITIGTPGFSDLPMALNCEITYICRIVMIKTIVNYIQNVCKSESYEDPLPKIE